MIKRLANTIIALCLCWAAQAQIWQVQTDTANILIGEVITLNIKAQLPVEMEYTWPAFTDTLDGMEVLTIGDILEKSSQDSLWKLQTITLTSFDTGYYVLKPITIQLKETSLTSDPIIIQVYNPDLPKDAQFTEIKKPLEAPFEWKKWWTLSIVSLHALLLFWALWILRKKGERKQAVFQTQDLRSPIQKFKDGIRIIRENKAWLSNNDKQFYSELTLLVRQYLEEEYHIQALESTTYEVKPEIQSLTWNNTLKANIIALLEEADLIKFAKAVSTEQQKLIHFDNVQELLNYLEEEAKKIEDNIKTYD